MSTERKYFHFTIGPVQGFVAQARRTRDFWAGSFILSWLAAVAMKAVEKQGGEIIFPTPDKDYLAGLEGKGSQKKPRQGSIPNRFMAHVIEGFDPDQVKKSVRIAWQGLAEMVWDNDLAAHCEHTADTRIIWDRQINNFWDMSWVFGAESNVLDRRKNWRSYRGTVEAGVKCMMMEGWQELSGVAGPLKPDALRQAQFWKLIRSVGRKGMATDLIENEHLCAIAFVKRRFARWFHEVSVSMPGGWILQGWKLEPGAPSVMYMAAAHWLERIILQETAANLERLHDAARQVTEIDGEAYPEHHTDIHCVSNACRDKEESIKKLAALDAGVFFKHVLENPKLSAEAPEKIMRLKRALKDLAISDSPTPFYAVLLMDGDSLGALMSDPENQPKISKALEYFTNQAQAIVYKHNGFLIYAGGDDVLALLPLEDALSCAAALRQHYLDSFENAFQKPAISTLSGAIEYIHVKAPLTRVLKDAHDLLDEVAKDARGRDAIAIRVWKPGGKALEWAMPWKKAVTQTGEIEIQRLAAEFSLVDKNLSESESEKFSNKFFYKIRERFELLNPASKDKAEQSVLSNRQAAQLLAVDYLASGVNKDKKYKLTLKEAEKIIDPLLGQCRPAIRKLHNGSEIFESSNRLEEDGALLVRFLAQKGAEQR